MLALMLSGVVGLASFVFFLSAFFAPKLHRKDDFLWSGFGFFYALVLWICAQRFTGAILLGQLAIVCLLLAFAWQTLRLRAAIANQTIAEVPSFSLLDWVGGGLKRKPKAPKVQPPAETPPPVVAEQKKAITEKTVAEEVVEKVDQVLDAVDTPTPVVEAVEEIVETALLETAAPEEIESTATVAPENSQPEPSPPPAAITSEPKTPAREGSLQDRPKKPKSKLFQWLFRGKKDQQPSTPSTNIADVIESMETEDEDWGEADTVEEIVAAVEDAVEEAVAEAIPPEDNEVVVEEAVPSEDSEENEDHQVVAEESPPVLESPEDAVAEIPPAATEEETTASEAATVEAEVVIAPESDQVDVAETSELEPETVTSEPGATAETLPIIPPSTTEAEESSNWDDLEQEFDSYLGDDDASTKIEQEHQASADKEDQDNGDQSESDTVDAETEPPKPQNPDPA